MVSPRNVLNELRWRHDALPEVQVTYRHRGAPGDERTVAGADLLDLGTSFFEIRDRGRTTPIPYHRILRIRRDDVVVWERRRPG